MGADEEALPFSHGSRRWLGRLKDSSPPGVPAMTTTVKATYADGVLTPTEPLDIEEGKEVTLSIDDAPAAGGGLAAIAVRVTELQETMPTDTTDSLPTDLAMNKKHYLYGHSKQENA